MKKELAPIIRTVQTALTLLGYLATAAAFYYLAARSAMKVEEKNTSLPSQVSLTVVEGGASKTSETRKVA